MRAWMSSAFLTRGVKSMDRNDSVVELMVELLNEGLSIRQIAKQLGIAEWRMKLLADELEQRRFGFACPLDSPTPEEEVASRESLDLAPEVAERAQRVRSLGLSDPAPLEGRERVFSSAVALSTTALQRR